MSSQACHCKGVSTNIHIISSFIVAYWFGKSCKCLATQLSLKLEVEAVWALVLPWQIKQKLQIVLYHPSETIYPKMSTRLPSMRYSLLVRDLAFIPIVSNCYLLGSFHSFSAQESSRHQEPWAAACSDASYATAARWSEFFAFKRSKAKKYSDVTMLRCWYFGEKQKKNVFWEKMVSLTQPLQLHCSILFVCAGPTRSGSCILRCSMRWCFCLTLCHLVQYFWDILSVAWKDDRISKCHHVQNTLVCQKPTNGSCLCRLTPSRPWTSCAMLTNFDKSVWLVQASWRP